MSEKNPKSSSPDPAGSSSSAPTAAAAAAVESTNLPSSSTQQTENPPPPFEPPFTLLTNTTTGQTIHPRVQYLFSDDDTSILSDPPLDHRALVVDLVPNPDHTGWAVSWASSLSPDFALTDSHLAVQRSDGGDGDTSIMLRLEGAEREHVDDMAGLPSSGSGPAAVLGKEDVESLVDEFKRRMGVLRKVVGESEKRREIVAQQAGDTGSQRDGDEEGKVSADAEQAAQ